MATVTNRSRRLRRSRPPQLPVEVVEHIIDLVNDLGHDQSLATQNFCAIRIWSACALTCRAFAPRSQYWLFQDISLRKQSQAESIMRVLRANPALACYTRVLRIRSVRVNEWPRMENHWISWLPQLLAPIMKNLVELQLAGDIFSAAHISFPMALTAFKSIRKLILDNVHFSTFGHCSRLFRAFPYLNHLQLYDISWKPAPHVSRSIRTLGRTRRRRSEMAHLDLWGIYVQDSELAEVMRWLLITGHHTTLKTLCIADRGATSTSVLLRCASSSKSIFLMLDRDNPIDGLEHCNELKMLHIDVGMNPFPVQAVTSIARLKSSKQLLKVTLYLDVEELTDGVTGSEQSDLDAYLWLDNALCNPELKSFNLLLLLRGSDSANAVVAWTQRLSRLLPRLCSVDRLMVESSRIKYPIWR